MPHAQALASLPRPLLVIALVGAASLTALTVWPRSPSQSSFDPRCESWDMQASNALAGLIRERDETAEAYLGDAVFRLRRARKHCRYGFVPLARLDYDALLGNRYKSSR
jgi:hypothetical protein